MNLRKLSEGIMEKDNSENLKKTLADIDIFIKQKKFEDARLCLEKVKLKSPNNPAYYKGLAKLAQANQEWGKALEMWQELEQFSPQDITAIIGQGNALIELGKFEEAETTLQKAKAMWSDHPASYEGLARVASRNKRWDEALEKWREVEQRFPENNMAIVNQGNALIELGKFEEAETTLQKTKVMWPNHLASYEGLARIAYRTKMWPKALKRWQEVESLFPESTVAIIGQGKSLIELGEFEEAETILQKAKAKWPKHPLVISFSTTLQNKKDTLFNSKIQQAKHCLKKKKFKEAEIIFNEAQKLFPNDLNVLTGLAQVFQFSQRKPEAIKRWQVVIDNFPENLDARVQRGTLLSQINDLDEAIKVFSQIIKLFPEHLASYKSLAKIFYRVHKWNDSLEIWQKIEQKFSASIETVIGQVNALIELGEIEKAEALLENAKTTWPDKPEFYERLAQLAQKRQMRQLAYEHWDKFTSKFPNHLGARIQRGHALIKLGKLDEAERSFLKARDDWPKRSSPLEGLAYTYQVSNQTEKALTLWEDIIKRFPKILKAHIAKGEVLLTLGKREVAEACFKEAMNTWPDSVEPYDRFALVAYKSENWSEAKVRFEAVTKRFPDHVSADLKIGEILTKLDKWEEAAEYYKDLIERWPNKLGPSMDLARMYQNNGQLSEAQRFLETTIKQFPSNLGLKLQYGNLFIKMDKIPQAEQVFAEAANLWPDYSSPIESLALVAEKSLDWQKALEFWDKVLQSFPHHIKARIQKAKVLLELGELTKAKTLLNEIKESSPDHIKISAIENLAHVASRAKDWRETRELWIQVIKERPHNFNKFICQNLIPLHLGEYLIKESGHFKLKPQEIIETIEKRNKKSKFAAFSNVFRSKKSIPPMDIVYTWVDDQDDAWIRNKEDTLLKLLGQEAIEKYNAEHSKEFRFRNMDELKYSLRSINKYLPFIRNIYIVTAGHAPSWLNYDSGKIFIINHKDIFPNKKHLPTFNSEAIECHVPLIPNLSEYFLYFNDDVMIDRTLQFNDLFLERDVIKLYVDARLSARGQPHKEELGVRSGRKNANVALDKFFKQEPRYVLSHVPRLLNTSLCQDAIKVFSQEVELTSSCQFRSIHSHNVANGLYPYYAYYQGKAKLEIIQDTMVKLTDNKGLNEQYLWTAYKKNPRFLCIQDTIQAPNKILKDQFQHWMNKLYPKKSPFEI